MGALQDALNGLEGNEAALKELSTLTQAGEAAAKEVDSLKVSNADLTNTANEFGPKETALAETIAQKDARILELGGQVTEGTNLRDQLTASAKELGETKKTLEDLEAANKVDVTGRLEAYGLKPDSLKERSLDTLKAMEEAALGSRTGGPEGGQLPGKGQGLGGGGGNPDDGPKTALEQAGVEMAKLRANPNGTKADEKVIS